MARDVTSDTEDSSFAGSPVTETLDGRPIVREGPGAGAEVLDGASLLVVDDNENNRDLLQRRLERFGARVRCASDGERALEMARPERFQLVLLDVMMPGVSGLEVLAQLRQRYSAADLPIIMVTARGESSDVCRSLELGANDHVAKPIDFPVLIARTAAHLKLRYLSQLKDEFLRIASHDLKNPLSVLSMGIQHLRESALEGPLGEYDMRVLGKLHRGCGDMQRIIDDFLDLDALQHGDLPVCAAPTQLNELVARVVANQRPLAEKKSITLGTALDPSIETVGLDASRIGQVLDNLIGNAIKFGRSGDEVSVKTRGIACAVRVEVIDTGRGIGVDEEELLFQKYRRLRARPTGGESSSGLGLFIARRIVERHGGVIGAHNNKGRPGCTFWFHLPSDTLAETLGEAG